MSRVPIQSAAEQVVYDAFKLLNDVRRLQRAEPPFHNLTPAERQEQLQQLGALGLSVAPTPAADPALHCSCDCRRCGALGTVVNRRCEQCRSFQAADAAPTSATEQPTWKSAELAKVLRGVDGTLLPQMIQMADAREPLALIKNEADRAQFLDLASREVLRRIDTPTPAEREEIEDRISTMDAERWDGLS